MSTAQLGGLTSRQRFPQGILPGIRWIRNHKIIFLVDILNYYDSLLPFYLGTQVSRNSVSRKGKYCIRNSDVAIIFLETKFLGQMRPETEHGNELKKAVVVERRAPSLYIKTVQEISFYSCGFPL